MDEKRNNVRFGTVPVSYTHLDVYKRQVPCFLPRCGNTARHPGCSAAGADGKRGRGANPYSRHRTVRNCTG